MPFYLFLYDDGYHSIKTFLKQAGKVIRGQFGSDCREKIWLSSGFTATSDCIVGDRSERVCGWSGSWVSERTVVGWKKRQAEGRLAAAYPTHCNLSAAKSEIPRLSQKTTDIPVVFVYRTKSPCQIS